MDQPVAMGAFVMVGGVHARADEADTDVTSGPPIGLTIAAIVRVNIGMVGNLILFC